MKLRIALLLLLPFGAAGNLFAQLPDSDRDSLVYETAYEPQMLPTAYYTDGVRLAAEERYDEALVCFLRATELEPDHAPSLYEMANIMIMLGDSSKALEYSSRAAKLDPDNIWFKGQRARLLASLGQYDQALPLFESMLGRNHMFEPDNYRILSVLYYQLGRPDEAIAILDSAEVRMGKSPEVTDLKRSILIEGGRVDEAIAVTERYIAATPYDEENRLVLADLYGYQKRDSMKMVMLKEVLDINPNNVNALVNLADNYLDQGSTSLYFATLKQVFLLEEVPLNLKIDHFKKLTRNSGFYRQYFAEISGLALTLATRYSGNTEVIELYADHMIRGGDIEGALTMLKTSLSLPDPSLSTFMQVIEIEAYLQRPDSVALYSDMALKAYPDEQAVFMLKAGALQYMNRNKEARKVLEQALRKAETDSLRSEILGSIGTVWHAEGNLKKTYKYYEQALSYDANNALVLNNYAYFLSEEGRHLDRALGMASRAVKLVENSATYLDTYAWVLYKQGNYAEAKKVMQQALPLDSSNSAELLMHYGDILHALGENFMASVYWKRARDAGYEQPELIEERLSRLE